MDAGRQHATSGATSGIILYHQVSRLDGYPMIVIRTRDRPKNYISPYVYFVMITMCVLHMKPFFLPVDIQHTQCPRVRADSSSQRDRTSSVVRSPVNTLVRLRRYTMRTV